MTERLAESRGGILSIHCNDTHAFCRQGNGTVGVYNLGSGQLTRELAPPEENFDIHISRYSFPVVGEEVVAAAFGGNKVMVWSSKGAMEELHTLNVQDYSCSDVSCEHGSVIFTNIRSVLVVDCSKVAILVEQVRYIDLQRSSQVSLILLEKVNGNWENKNLGCFPSCLCSLASDGAWLALLVGEQEKIKLWRGSESQEDISLAESDCKFVTRDQVDMFIEIPHIILIVPGYRNSVIKVYKMEATVLHLIKSIQVEGPCTLRPIANKFCLGILTSHSRATSVHLFTKKELFTDGLSPDETERRTIVVEGSLIAIAMNTTSLLSVLMDKRGEEMGLIKNYFWV